MSLLAAVFFALGAIVASFMGVVAARLHTGESILFGRSRCDACNAPLPPLSLVPLFSYMSSRGRARCCGARLSPRSPVAELALGALFALSYAKLGMTATLPFVLASLSVLLALVLYDLAHQILPLRLILLFLVFAGITASVSAPSPSDLLTVTLVALLIGGGIGLLHVLSRGRAMGLADAPLAFGLSLFAGPAAFSGLVFSFWIGAVVGIAILFTRPRGSRMGIEVPFAPFLAAGFILAYFTQWSLTTLFAPFP